MHLHALLFLFLTTSVFAADFKLPANLSQNDVPIISQSFAAGFLTRTPMSLVGQDNYKTQVAVRVNTIDTSKVSKLGSGSENKEVQVQEFSFSKQLPLNVELGVHSSFSVFDKDISTFGGYFRWGFQAVPGGNLSLVGHAGSGNFRNVIGTNLYGGMLSLDLNFWSVNFSLGTGTVRSTNTFDASLFGLAGPQPSINYAKMYSHQMVKVAYVWDNISISAQGDWLKEFFSSANLAYLF